MKRQLLAQINKLGNPRPSELTLNHASEKALRQMLYDGELIMDANRRLSVPKKKTAISDACEFLEEEWRREGLPKLQAKIMADIQEMNDEIIAALELAMNNLAPDSEAYEACEKAIRLLK